MQRMRENKKLLMEKRDMTQTVRLDREAFRRGVEDAMTLAPLRDAVRSASSVFSSKRGEGAVSKEKRDIPGTKEMSVDDGKSSRR